MFHQLTLAAVVPAFVSDGRELKKTQGEGAKEEGDAGGAGEAGEVGKEVQLAEAGATAL